MHERFSQTAWLENRIRQGIRFLSASCQRHPLSELAQAKKTDVSRSQRDTAGKWLKTGKPGGMAYDFAAIKRLPITSQSTTSKNAFT